MRYDKQRGRLYDHMLLRAIHALPQPSPEKRAEIYQRARDALLRHLQTAAPPFPKADIAIQRQLFEEAVSRVEAQFGAPAPTLTPSETPQGAAREPTWLTGLLSRASQEQDFPAPPPPEPSNRPISILPYLRRSSKRTGNADPAHVPAAPENTSAILERLQSQASGLEACALISSDGAMIASSLPPGMEETRIAQIATTLQTLGGRAAIQLSRGEAKEILLRGDKGYAILVKSDRGALLLALADSDAKLGLVLLDMRKTLQDLEDILDALRSAANPGPGLEAGAAS